MGSKSSEKRLLGINVLDAARARIARSFDDFPRIYASFSGGKDSTVMLHLIMDEARKRNRKIGVLFVDLEAQYALTIQHVTDLYAEYGEWIEPYWVCLPLNLRNAVSQFEPQWRCWDAAARPSWVRQPPGMAITESPWDWFKPGMEFEEFVPLFGEWYAQGKMCGCFVGIRTAESLNRWRTITNKKKGRMDGLCWTTRVIESTFNLYPIYDWKTEDIWTYLGKHKMTYNRLYDRMHAAGLSIHQQRICQPYGDDQRKGLWLFSVIEPETWALIVARVNGANQGALYARESGNILGRIKVRKPDGHTWQSFTNLLLSTLPPERAEHFKNKIAVFLMWYSQRGFGSGIPDEQPPGDEKKAPSWMRICKAILRNDYWCKGLSFSQHKTEAFARYQKIMKKRRDEWKIY